MLIYRVYRHFGPLKSKAKQLEADLKADCMFPADNEIKMTNFLFVGLPGTKVCTMVINLMF